MPILLEAHCCSVKKRNRVGYASPDPKLQEKRAKRIRKKLRERKNTFYEYGANVNSCFKRCTIKHLKEGDTR